MNDDASLLHALVDAAESVLTKPALAGLERLEHLRVEVERVHAIPAPDGKRLVDVEAVLLAQVLRLAEQHRNWQDYDRAALLQQLAGVLLPPVRAAFGRAIEARRRIG